MDINILSRRIPISMAVWNLKIINGNQLYKNFLNIKNVVIPTFQKYDIQILTDEEVSIYSNNEFDTIKQ